jgi:hypothetical protein
VTWLSLIEKVLLLSNGFSHNDDGDQSGAQIERQSVPGRFRTLVGR